MSSEGEVILTKLVEDKRVCLTCETIILELPKYCHNCGQKLIMKVSELGKSSDIFIIFERKSSNYFDVEPICYFKTRKEATNFCHERNMKLYFKRKKKNSDWVFFMHQRVPYGGD